MSAVDVFWERTDRRSPDECWEWQGYISPSGYGYLTHRQRSVRAHRMSYTIHKGPIPSGLVICHHCDNRKCVNPSHLYAGTAADNNRDMMERGRWRDGDGKGASGEANGKSKLTDAAVREIIPQLLAGRRNGAAIGRKYGVSKVTVGDIRNRRTWNHIWAEFDA